MNIWPLFNDEMILFLFVVGNRGHCIFRPRKREKNCLTFKGNISLVCPSRLGDSLCPTIAANPGLMFVPRHQASSDLCNGQTPPCHSHDSRKKKKVLWCLIVALYKAEGNVSLDCTCFLLPCIFIKNPDAAAGAPLLYNVKKDCKGKHMWPTSSHQIK